MKPYCSDDALAKQAALAALPEGAVAPFSMLLGICEPRVKPTDAERCNCCGLDARDSEGGEAIDGKRWCFICIGRGHHASDYEQSDPHAPGCLDERPSTRLATWEPGHPGEPLPPAQVAHHAQLAREAREAARKEAS
jgi:hypothetical protein